MPDDAGQSGGAGARAAAGVNSQFTLSWGTILILHLVATRDRTPPALPPPRSSLDRWLTPASSFPWPMPVPLFCWGDVGGTNIDWRRRRPRSAAGWTSIATEVELGPGDPGSEFMRRSKVLVEAGLNDKAIVRVGLGTPGTMAKGILLAG